jgi:uncharacterized protein
MSLSEKITAGLKEAMKQRNDAKKRTLRAIKAQLLLLKTDGTGEEVTEEKEIKMLQKMLKERQDSYTIYMEQGREDLAGPEQEEMGIIKEYLPAQLSEAELTEVLKAIVAETGASSMKEMGRVMGMATKKLGATADGKMISKIVKELLG